MSHARKLLDDLAVIGATVEPSGTQLILRAGPAVIPGALVRRVREAKSDLIAMLSSAGKAKNAISEQDPADIEPIREKSRSEARLIQWLDQHPSPSLAGACAWCRKAETPTAVVVPFGVQPGTHTWLHAECWPAWRQARRAEALRALEAAQSPG